MEDHFGQTVHLLDSDLTIFIKTLQETMIRLVYGYKQE